MPLWFRHSWALGLLALVPFYAGAYLGEFWLRVLSLPVMVLGFVVVAVWERRHRLR
jgi:hypothetical protein